MKKLIIKTAVITVLAIIAAIMFVCEALYLFSPKTLGNLLDNLGESQAAVQFYEKQYNSSQENDDLITLLDTAQSVNDYAVLQKYYGILVEKKDFSEICARQDAKNTKSKIKYVDYVYSNYVIAIYNNDTLEKTEKAIKAYIKDYGYNENNCVRALIYDCSQKMTKDELISLRSLLQDTRPAYYGTERQNMTDDINTLTTLINEKTE